MPPTLRPSEAIAARAHPDPTEAPSGRIEAGTELAELERMGDWVRVETPSGARWWVDGRRLVSVALPPEPVEPSLPVVPPSAEPSAPPPPPQPPAEPGAEVQPREAPPEPGRRRPRLLVGVLVLAVLLAGVGAVMLLTSTGPETPRVLRGWFALDAAPDIAVSGDFDSAVYLLSNEAIIIGDHWFAADDFSLGTGQLPEVGEVIAAVGLSSDRVAVLTDQPAVVTVTILGQPGITANGADEIAAVGPGAVVLERYPLPAGDYAAAIAGYDFPDDTVFVFPESGGRSNSFLRLDLDSGTIDEHPLAETVEVVSALHHAYNHLYVGHTAGVLVHLWDNEYESGAVWECPMRSFEMGNPTLAAVTLRREGAEGLLDWVVALDRDRSTLTVIDGEGGDFEPICGDGFARSPYVMGSIDLGRPVGADARVAAGFDLDAAYVLTDSGDLLIVDLGNPAEPRNDRITVIPGLGSAPSADIALYSTGSSNVYHAFVVDGQRLWWIAPDGPEGRDQLDLADVEVRR